MQFSNPTEAKRAHSSTEAVLNNRFIRIYFLRKDHISAQMPLTEVTLEVDVQCICNSSSCVYSSFYFPQQSPASVAISTIHGAPPTALPLDKVMHAVVPATRRESSENHVSEVSKVSRLVMGCVCVCFLLVNISTSQQKHTCNLSLFRLNNSPLRCILVYRLSRLCLLQHLSLLLPNLMLLPQPLLPLHSREGNQLRQPKRSWSFKRRPRNCCRSRFNSRRFTSYVFCYFHLI